nr:hypothetical protein [Herpetosiphonaceae bacterium]
AYSVWQQGAGKINPVDAVLNSATTESANLGLDLTLDRDHENGTHYIGTTTFDEATKTFSYVDAPEGWAGSYNSWAGSYNSQADDIICETCLFIPLIAR